MLNCERVLLPKSPAKHNNVLGLRVVSTCRSLRQNDLPTAKTWMASKPSRKTIKIFKIGSTPPRVVSHTNIEMIVADPLIKSRLKSRAVWVFHWPRFPSPSSQSYPAIGRRSSQKSPVPIQLFWIGYFPILKSRRLLWMITKLLGIFGKRSITRLQTIQLSGYPKSSENQPPAAREE